MIKLHQQKEKKKDRNLKLLVISMILAVLLFVALLVIERGILADYERTWVVVAARDVETGTEITADNVRDFFTRIEMDVNKKPVQSTREMRELENMVVMQPLVRNEIVLSHHVVAKETLLQDIRDPIEIGFQVSHPDQVVGGILRAGDLIDISVVQRDLEAESEKNIQILQHAYISRVFDANGSPIERYGQDTPAVIINIIIDKENEGKFNEAITGGTVRVSKVNPDQI